MNALLKKLVLCSTAAFAVAILLSMMTPAYAQRDAGAKARGEIGTGFWNPKYQSRRSSPSGVQMRRVYSYEPTAAASGWQRRSSQGGTTERAALQPQVERRSYSYGPLYRTSCRTNSAKKESWQYPKTDPRRYRR